MADKDILYFDKSSKSINDAESDDENEMNNAALIPMSSEMRNIRKPRLPDSIARPIAIMPLSRMENTTFAMPSIIDSHDMGLRTVYSPDAQKKTPIQR
ncbi:hypothetical protein TNCV_2361841 [Trichonephila clavipes]|nr:hypothetical protein TNCV_2361841 [Trichonephila clavipes]